MTERLTAAAVQSMREPAVCPVASRGPPGEKETDVSPGKRDKGGPDDRHALPVTRLPLTDDIEPRGATSLPGMSIGYPVMNSLPGGRLTARTGCPPGPTQALQRVPGPVREHLASLKDLLSPKRLAPPGLRRPV